MATTPPDNSAMIWQPLMQKNRKSDKKCKSRPAIRKEKTVTSNLEPSIESSSELPEARDPFAERIHNFSTQRCLKLWMIVMISIRQLPYSDHKTRLREEKESFKQYRKRLRFLKGRTTTAPQEGLALCLPNHPSRESDKKSEQYYDAVSALNALRFNGHDIPPVVESMIGNWEQIPLPSGSHDPIPEGEKEKRDNSARIIAGMNKNAQLLLAEMIRLRYGKPITAQTKGEILQQLVKDVAPTVIGRDGIKTQLELILKGYES